MVTMQLKKKFAHHKRLLTLFYFRVEIGVRFANSLRTSSAGKLCNMGLFRISTSNWLRSKIKNIITALYSVLNPVSGITRELGLCVF